MRAPFSTNRHRGFTLMELVVVVIILGVLAAVAVPRFVNIGTQARIASLQTMGGALMTAAVNIRMACKVDPACASSGYNVLIGGVYVQIYMGWPDAGDYLGAAGYSGATEIDYWVNYSGFTPAVSDPWTQFKLDGAPDPANCWVKYTQAGDSVTGPSITYATSGC